MTDGRPTPLVPFGCGYRLIDFTLSNALHSQVDHLFVLTQYKGEQVSRYLHERWGAVGGRQHFAVPLAPKRGKRYWGSCHALLQNLPYAERDGARDAIVLSADHIYRMDYRELLAFHRDQNADATIATTTVDPAAASQHGVVRLDDDGRIADLWEKPNDGDLRPDSRFPQVVNMGVYVFRIAVLRSLIGRFDADLGRHLLPRLVRQARVMAFRFELTRPAEASFWMDVGTIESYFEARRALLRGSLSPANPDWTVRGGLLTGELGQVNKDWGNSIVSPIATMKRPNVRDSVTGPEVFVGPDSSVHDSILMPRASIGRGRGAHVRHAIVADGAHVPDRSSIGLHLRSGSSAGHAGSAARIAVVDGGPAYARARESLPWGRGLILLADGDPDCRGWTRKTLENEGYSVLVVAGAVRFMEVMVEYRGKLRLVICGANFDGHTADELVHLIRDNLKRDVGIVVRVEGPVQSERGVTNLFRPDAFLTLPFSAAQLIATVDELVRDRASKQEVSRRLPDPEDGKTLPFGKDSR